VLMARMINKFPMSVITYMQRNREKRRVHALAFLTVPVDEFRCAHLVLVVLYV
jgi:hypothetical protein